MALRTTVTLDPDVHVLLRDTMRKSGAPFKQVLNNAIRDGLSSAARRSAGAPQRFHQRTFDMGAPLVDLTKANQLAGELEDEALIAKMRQGR